MGVEQTQTAGRAVQASAGKPGCAPVTVLSCDSACAQAAATQEAACGSRVHRSQTDDCNMLQRCQQGSPAQCCQAGLCLHMPTQQQLKHPVAAMTAGITVTPATSCTGGSRSAQASNMRPNCALLDAPCCESACAYAAASQEAACSRQVYRHHSEHPGSSGQHIQAGSHPSNMSVQAWPA